MHRSGVFGVSEGFADGHTFDARYINDLSGPGFFHVNLVQSLGDADGSDLGRLDRAVSSAPRDDFSASERAAVYPADGYSAHIGGCIQVGDVGTQRFIGIVLGWWDVFEHDIKEGVHTGAWNVCVMGGDS